MSTAAAAAPTNRGVPSASTKFARGIRSISRRITGLAADSLLVAEHQAVHVQTLPLSETVVGGEEVGPSTNERTARRKLEVVPLERVRVGRRELEVVACVERVVSQEPERLAV